MMEELAIKQRRFRTVYFPRKVQTEPGGPLGGKPSHAEWLGRNQVCTI